MAISENIPGLDVTIEVDGIALPEYNDESACDKRFLCSSSKYVEAPPGAEFAIRYLFRPPFSPPFDVLMDILLDNQYVPVPYFEGGGKDGCEGYVYSKASMKKDGRDFMQKFRFTELSTAETDMPLTKTLQQRLADIGRITLHFCFIEHFESTNPAEVAQLHFDNLGILGEKAMQKGGSFPGDVLSHQTSLTALEEHENVDYNHIRTVLNDPFATFNFYYRSTAALKSLGVIPSTPLLLPEQEPAVEEKDPDDMTLEELRKEARQHREQKQLAARIKHEHQDDKVMLGVGAEVVDLC